MNIKLLATVSATIGVMMATSIAANAHEAYGGYGGDSGYDGSYRARRINRFLHENGIPHSHGYGYSRGGYHEYLHEEGIPHGGLNHYLHDNGIPHYHDD